MLVVLAQGYGVVSFATDAGAKDSRSASNSSVSISTQNALKLYNEQNYAAAAAAFENIIQTVKPSATLFYYAALANQQCHKSARASQLFKYIVDNFPGTQEATYSQKVLSAKRQISSVPQNNSQDSELPESVKNLLPSEMQAMLNTAEGKAIAQQAMRDQGGKVQAIRNAEKRGTLDTSGAISYTKIPDANNQSLIQYPFKVQDIAKDGAGGIDQGRNPNCWFEASISALAQLPRGQQLLANTVRSKQGDKYVVRFRNDGAEYTISQDDLIKHGIHDKALWASLIECAELKKFPNNQGANGEDSDQSRLEIGLGCITGCKAEIISPSNCDTNELSSFIGSAIKSQNPIVAATFGAIQLANMPQILVPQHAYTIIDFDPSKNIVTLRNPHGRKSKVFQTPGNATDIEFQQLGDGIVKLGLTTFQKYFHSTARSFI